MQEFFPEIDVRDAEAEAIARGLYAIAQADGEIHPKELALITEFLIGGSDNPAAFTALERSDLITPDELATHLGSQDVRRLFVKTALLMAYADNQYSSDESALLAEFAQALDISAQDLVQFEEQVKDYLLSQLTHLQNTAATAEVAKELGM